MRIFAYNGSDTWLNDDFKEFENRKIDENFIVYNQFLKQLHLPYLKWQYSNKDKENIQIETLPELEQMDFIVLKQLEYAKLVAPMRLFTYYLLQQYIGNNLNYSSLGIVRGAKNRLLFLDSDINYSEMAKGLFYANDLSRFLFKKANKKDLLITQESFFVLINKNFELKLLNALTQFQSKTGVEINKKELIKTVLNADRLTKFKAFSKAQIELL